jgi:hypothetical protein
MKLVSPTIDALSEQAMMASTSMERESCPSIVEVDGQGGMWEVVVSLASLGQWLVRAQRSGMQAS